MIFKLIVIPKLELEGEIVSSTRIRHLLSEGKVEEANRLMEDLLMICGSVVHGNHMGAEVLQMPTANQIPLRINYCLQMEYMFQESIIKMKRITELVMLSKAND